MKLEKYPLEMVGQQTVELPVGSKILCTRVEDGKPVLYAAVDPTATKKARVPVVACCAGDDIPVGFQEYLGTVDQESKNG
jgi:hypothetical protein